MSGNIGCDRDFYLAITLQNARADMPERDPYTPIERLRNLGPVSRGWLVDIGITTLKQLQDIGPVLAFKLVQHRHQEASLNLLYSLHAAVHDLHWTEISPEERERLKREAAEPLEPWNPPSE